MRRASAAGKVWYSDTLRWVLRLSSTRRTTGTEVDPEFRLFRTFGEGNRNWPRGMEAPGVPVKQHTGAIFANATGPAWPGHNPIRLINLTRQICPSHCPVLHGLVSASLMAS